MAGKADAEIKRQIEERFTAAIQSGDMKKITEALRVIRNYTKGPFHIKAHPKSPRAVPVKKTDRLAKIARFLLAEYRRFEPSDNIHEMPFHARLRRCREEKGLTQQQVAEASGISPGYLSKLENGPMHKPSDTALALLCKTLGLDPIEAASELGVVSPEVLSYIQDRPAAVQLIHMMAHNDIDPEYIISLLEDLGYSRRKYRPEEA